MVVGAELQLLNTRPVMSKHCLIVVDSQLHALHFIKYQDLEPAFCLGGVSVASKPVVIRH